MRVHREEYPEGVKCALCRWETDALYALGGKPTESDGLCIDSTIEHPTAARVLLRPVEGPCLAWLENYRTVEGPPSRTLVISRTILA